MIAFSFVVFIAFIFVGLVFYENQKYENPNSSLPSSGLWQWLTQADWPSKVGAVLVIIGVGALLRYMMINIQVPPEAKIASGAGISLVLALAAFGLRNNPNRRALHTALAGSALATSYLTIFSAHKFFGFLTQVNAFNMLVVVCAFGAIFAIRRKAASIAVLAMFGAFMVPTFAFGKLVPTALVAYFIALSTISWGIVRQMNWRSVMHLSILFALLGGLPFMTDFSMKLPIALQALDFTSTVFVIVLFLMLHLAMTLTPSQAQDAPETTAWKERLSVGDIWLIGALTELLALSYADGRSQVGLIFAVMGAMWAVAAFVARYLERKDIIHYIFFAVFCAVTAFICYFKNVPWSLSIEAIFLLLLWQAPRLDKNTDNHNIPCIGMLMAALAYMVTSADTWQYRAAFDHIDLFYHLTAAAMLLIGAWISKERGLNLSAFMGWLGGLWGGIVLIHEMIAWQLPPAVISMTAAIIGAVLVLLGEKRKKRIFWSCGMALMAVAAVKMVFFDFGSLGQLANILAVIGTGLLFMGINWLAPLPPAEDPEIVEARTRAADNELREAFTAATPRQNTGGVKAGQWALITTVAAVGLCLFWKVSSFSGMDGFIWAFFLVPATGIAILASCIATLTALIKGQTQEGLASIFIWIVGLLFISFAGDAFRVKDRSYHTDLPAWQQSGNSYRQAPPADVPTPAPIPDPIPERVSPRRSHK